MTTTKHPIQPIVTDEGGVLRFKENCIVRDLLDFATEHGFGLNEIARRDYSREDRQQLAQLIGYSLSGYGDLRSYVDDAAFIAATTPETILALLDDYEALQDECDALRAKTSMSIGVGDGSGNLFVYGGCESINRVQELIFECEKLRLSAERWL